jgi:hypothetical protein
VELSNLDVLTKIIKKHTITNVRAEFRTRDFMNTKRSVNYVSGGTNIIRLSRVPEVPTSNLCRGSLILT